MNKVNKDTFKTLKKVLNIIWTYDFTIRIAIDYIDIHLIQLNINENNGFYWFKILVTNNNINILNNSFQKNNEKELSFILNSHFQIQEAINE